MDPNLFRQQAFVGGTWIDAPDGARIDVRNPANGERLGSVPDLGTAATRAAIEAAQAAMPGWAARTARERATILRRLYDLTLEHSEALAQILTAEQGKSLAEARSEIVYGGRFLEWFAEEASRVPGDVLPSQAADRRVIVLRQPVGIVAAITPWNFPFAMITRKLAPALAAGCPMVLKPAMETPFSALALAVLAQEAGVPDGLFSVVTGRPGPIGAELTGNPLVRKLTFTGSTPTGRLLLAQCAPTIKRTSMELGGNAPFIVFEDADVDAAVEGAMASKFRNCGQACVASNRFFVHDTVHDAFVERFAARAAALVVGGGHEAGSDIGPLINGQALTRIEGLIADAVASGARIITGGRPHARGGTFFEPTVLDRVTPDMKIANEEIFGPIAPVIAFSDEDAVLAMANASETGLAGYCYTRDLARFWRVSERLEVGMVGVNTGMISTEIAPFGGIKQSGHGREGSRYGLDDFLEMKYICASI